MNKKQYDRELMRQKRIENPTYGDNWKKNHPNYHKEWETKIKLECFNHYSPNGIKCANPYNFHKEEITDIRVLQLDHIEGSGKRQISSITSNFYLWLKRHNFPPGYQILCANCNWIKRWENKELLGIHRNIKNRRGCFYRIKEI